jgi:hypothetical protein
MLQQTQSMNRRRLAGEPVAAGRKGILEARRERLSRRLAAGAASSTPQQNHLLTLVQVGKASRPFFFVKLANLFLLTVGISLSTGLVAYAITDREFALSEPVIAVYFAALVFACVIAWRNLGVLDAVMRPATIISLVLLALAACPILVAVSGELGAIDWDDRDALLALFTVAYVFGGGALLALVSAFAVWRGRRARIRGLDLRVVDLLRALKSEATGLRPSLRVSRSRAARAAAFVLLGLGWTLAIELIPEQVFYELGLYHVSYYLGLPAYALLLYARFHLQPDAKDLLATDKRPPVLFLRSFVDDEKLDGRRAYHALFDFSLESRLGTHFGAIGPFIAVDSPKDSTPKLGASRVRLNDEEWQQAVLGWMDRARYLIVFAGDTRWATWELSQAIRRGYANKLILLFPEIRCLRIVQFFSLISGNPRRREIAAERLVGIRRVLTGTIWQEALSTIVAKPEQIRSIVLQPGGRVTVVTSTTRNRNSYHIAALVSQFLLSDRAGSQLVTATGGRGDSAFPSRRDGLAAA